MSGRVGTFVIGMNHRSVQVPHPALFRALQG
jgi:hypothetical protein